MQHIHNAILKWLRFLLGNNKSYIIPKNNATMYIPFLLILKKHCIMGLTNLIQVAAHTPPVCRNIQALRKSQSVEASSNLFWEYSKRYMVAIPPK